MQTSNTNQIFWPNDPVWVLLGELPLRDFLSDHDRRDGPMAGYLFQTVRELGMSPECMKSIARTLAGFAKEAFAHHKQGRPEIPGRIRIFCQKKIIDDVNPGHSTSRSYHAGKVMEHAQMILDSGMKMNGGWGYFLIERGGNVSTESSASSWNSVDLYLYKEGD